MMGDDFYIVIPTINGEINGKAIIVYELDRKIINFECTVYKINMMVETIEEIDFY